jgi:hypothetical protein
LPLLNDLAIRLRAETSKYTEPIKKAQDATKTFSEESKSLGDSLTDLRKRFIESNPVISGTVKVIGQIKSVAAAGAAALSALSQAAAPKVLKAFSESMASALDGLAKLSPVAARAAIGLSNVAKAASVAALQAFGDIAANVKEQLFFLSPVTKAVAAALTALNAALFQSNFDEFTNLASSLKNRLSVLQPVVGAVTGAFKTFRESIVSPALARFNGILGKARDGFRRLRPAVGRAGAAISKMGKTAGAALGGLNKALAGVAKRLVLLNPIVLTITAAVAALGGVFGIVTVKQAKFAAELDKTSVRTNTTVEDLSQLKFAVEQSGGSFDDLTLGLRTVNRTAAESVSGNRQFAKLYKDLGVEVLNANGSLKTGGELLEEVADGLQQFTTAGEKATVGTKLLGEDAFAKLLPLLEGGSEGIRQLKGEADDLGQTLSGSFAAQSTEFGNNVGRLKALAGGFGQAIAVQLLPILNKMVEQFLKAGEKVLPIFTSAFDEIVFQVTRGFRVFGAFVSLLKNLLARNLDEASNQFAKLKDSIFLTREEWDKLNAQANDDVIPTLNDTTVAVERQTTAFGKLVAVIGDLNDQPLTFAENLERLIKAGQAQGPQLPTEGEAFQATLGPLIQPPDETLLDKFRAFFADVGLSAQSAFATIKQGIDGIGGALVQSALGAKKAFSEFFKRFFTDIASAIARALFLRLILSFLPGGFGGAFALAGAAGRAVPAPAPPINLGSSQSRPGRAIASEMPRPTVIIEEPSPITRARFVDDEVVPRLRERRDDTGAEGF